MFGGAIAAILVMLSPQQGTDNVPPESLSPSDLAGRMAKAVDICRQHVQPARRVRFPSGAVPGFDAPALIKRFAATQPEGAVARPEFFIHVPGAGGDVWAVTYRMIPSCAIVVTDTRLPREIAVAAWPLLAQAGWVSNSSPAGTPWRAASLQRAEFPRSTTAPEGAALTLLAPAPSDGNGRDIQLTIRVTADMPASNQ